MLEALGGLIFLLGLAEPPSPAPDSLASVLRQVRAGDCAGAEPYLQSRIAREPRDVEMRRLLGHCYLKDSRWDDARRQFQAVLDLAPQDAGALTGLRTAVAEMQKQEQIRQALAIDAREQTGEKLKSTYDLREAERLLQEGKSQEAEHLLAGILERHPDSAPVAERLAQVYSSSRRFLEAAELYRRLGQAPGASPLYVLWRAQNLEWATRYADAEAVYRDYLKLRPDDLDARRGRALCLKLDGRCADAIPELRVVSEKRPADVEPLVALAQCYDQRHEADLAYATWQKVVALDPRQPGARKAREDYAKYFDELPRRRAYEALSAGRHDEAAKDFREYLEKHPDDTATRLQLARTLSWGGRWSDSALEYRRYLEAVPDDLTGRRELSRVLLWGGQEAEARTLLSRLVQDGQSTVEDDEALVQSYLRTGDLLGAEAPALALLKRNPGNAIATEAVQKVHAERRKAALEVGQGHVMAGRYAEANAAFRQYLVTFGADPDVERLVCRTLMWAKDWEGAAREYRAFLERHPDDVAARVELGNVESWAGRFDPAEQEYLEALRQEPANVSALLGLAQVRHYRGDEVHRVVSSYHRVLAVDSENQIAHQQLKELHEQGAPSLNLVERAFKDTDDFLSSVSTAEASVYLGARLRLTGFYTFVYVHQDRLVLGDSPAIAAINARARDVRGNGGGARLEFTSAAHWRVLGEVAPFSFDEAPDSVNARGEVLYHTRTDSTRLSLSYVRRDGFYDLYTSASLLAGIMGDTGTLQWSQNLFGKVRLHAAGAGARYSAGETPGFEDNRQWRGLARLVYEFNPLNHLGLSARATGFDRQSPLYFSPHRYWTAGGTFALGKDFTPNLRLLVDGEVEYAEVDGASSVEFAVRPALEVGRHSNLRARVGYRYGRSRTGRLGNPDYEGQGLDFSVYRVF